MNVHKKLKILVLLLAIGFTLGLPTLNSLAVETTETEVNPLHNKPITPD